MLHLYTTDWALKVSTELSVYFTSVNKGEIENKIGISIEIIPGDIEHRDNDNPV